MERYGDGSNISRQTRNNMKDEMKTVRIVIFGTGKLYQTNRNNFKKNIKIVSFVDNDSSKWFDELDGVKILPPNYLFDIDYDYIFILCSKVLEIREQLVDMKINMLKVYDLNHPELVFPTSGITYYESGTDKINREHIVLFSHALTETGANIVLYRTALVLIELGYNILLISREDGELRSCYLAAGIDVIIVPDIIFYRETWEKSVSNALFFIVNTFWFYYFIQELDDSLKSKCIWWIHETFPFPSVGKEQFHKCINGIRCVIAVSKRVEEEIKYTYEYDDLIVLPWGIPERKKDTASIDEEKFVFAIIGTIDSELKGQDIFIDAVEMLPDLDKKQAEFWIVGSGELPEHEQEVIQHNKCIKITGHIKQERIPELYSRIDAIVCPSRKEALSVVAVEAFMNEKIVIVSDVAGVVDYMMPNEDGFVFESGDIKKLSEIMHWVLYHRDKAKDIGKHSRKVYDTFFSMEQFRKRINKMIEMVS